MAIFFNSQAKEYNWLSCFSPHPIVDLKKAIWPTAEHAFQAQKTKDRGWRTAIRRAEHPAAAKRLGGNCPLRKDWEAVKMDMMYRIQKEKFAQSTELRNLLIATGDEELVHSAPWDRFLGNGPDGWGKNHLGLILMRVRKEIIKEIADDVYKKLEEAREEREENRY